MLIWIVAVMLAPGLMILLRPWPFFVTAKQLGGVNEKNIALEFGKWVERRAKAHGLNSRGVSRPIPMECPRCRKSSNYFVYPDELCERCWHNTLKQLSAPAQQTGK
jgi:hypothetical protein